MNIKAFSDIAPCSLMMEALRPTTTRLHGEMPHKAEIFIKLTVCTQCPVTVIIFLSKFC
jgi:hypothetical protein